MLIKPIQSDILVIGSGAAGLGLALSLAQHYSVNLLCKDDLLTSSSQHAQGGIAAVMSQTDSHESHINDTLKAGAGLCDKTIVEHTVREAQPAIEWLIQQGVQFTTTSQQPPCFHLTQEGGHSHRRILHAADKTGSAVVKTLSEQVIDHPNIHTYTEHTVTELLMEDHRCVGAAALDNTELTIKHFYASVTVLATGGAGGTYLHTSNPGSTTGDGIAIAFNRGARIANMEFMQFHPTSFYNADGSTFLITEVMRGEGATLILPNKKRFMDRYDPRGELASRDIVSRAIDQELKTHHIPHVYLDISHEDPQRIKTLFPTIYALCLKHHIDITTTPIPVVPATHYTCGGIVTNAHGQTDIDQLYAIGEVACTGLHGANRMASNSLLECIVFAKSAAKHIQQKIVSFKKPLSMTTAALNPPKNNAIDPEKISILYYQLRSLMSDAVGIVRSNARLSEALNSINEIDKEFSALTAKPHLNKLTVELRNALINAKLIVHSAKNRLESRGVHYNQDYPQQLPNAKNTVITHSHTGLDIAYHDNIHSLITKK